MNSSYRQDQNQHGFSLLRSPMADSNKMDYSLMNLIQIIISLFSANLRNIIIFPKFVLFKILYTALYYQRGSCRVKSIPIKFCQYHNYL